MPVSAFLALRPLILASRSPRRSAFLEDLGIPFTALPAPCAEPRPLPGEEPADYAVRAAKAKALAVFQSLGDRRDHPTVLAADTVVILRGAEGEEILGKPRDESEATAMLARLSGRTHQVVTACCLTMDGRTESFQDAAEVTFARWPLPVLEACARSGEALDKAGAYGIQGFGAFLVSEIRGSWTTVVGLPLDKTIRRLIDAGVLAVKV